MNNTLNVAVATDTILYAPFYLALYGGDFEDTPFGKLDINIIGQEGDMFFKTDNLPSKTVDGFVTLALLFGYADIGICDPSFIVDLYTAEKLQDVLEEPINGFIESLLPREKKAFYERFKTLFVGEKPEYTKIKSKFEENFDVKIVGGLIKKVAFLVVGKPLKEGDNEPIIGTPFSTQRKSDIKKDETAKNFNKIVSFPKPSTGYYVGDLLAPKDTKPLQYGEELSYIISDENVNDIALSCDFVSIDKLSEKLVIHKDYINSTDNAMFTGIIANFGNNNNTEKYKAFLYGIEKTLFNIDKILNKKYDNDLSIYFKNKLLNSKSKHYKSEKDLISLLVSDINVEEELIYKTEIEKYKDSDGKEQERKVLKEKDKKEITKTIDNLIYSFVQKLYDWKRNDSFLYYKSINSDVTDLQKIYKIRTGKDIETKDLKFKNIHNFNLLKRWKVEDKTITQKHKGWIWKLITNESFLLLFASIFVAVETIGVYTKFFHISPIFSKTIEHSNNTELHKEAVKEGFSINIHFIIIILFALIIIFIYWKSHRYIKFNRNKKYAFDLNNRKYSKFYLILNKMSPKIFKVN